MWYVKYDIIRGVFLRAEFIISCRWKDMKVRKLAPWTMNHHLTEPTNECSDASDYQYWNCHSSRHHHRSYCKGNQALRSSWTLFDVLTIFTVLPCQTSFGD